LVATPRGTPAAAEKVIGAALPGMGMAVSVSWAREVRLGSKQQIRALKQMVFMGWFTETLSSQRAWAAWPVDKANECRWLETACRLKTLASTRLYSHFARHLGATLTVRPTTMPGSSTREILTRAAGLSIRIVTTARVK
jgi:hypothetical protein